MGARRFWFIAKTGDGPKFKQGNCFAGGNYEKNTYRDRRCVQYFVDKGKDIVIPGLGFIKFMGNFTITLYLPYEVDAKVRDSFIA